MGKLTHFDDDAAARMVNVGSKPVTERTARATAEVTMGEETLQRILQGQVEKGSVIEVARLAGIMAAKRTADLIPLCHPIGLDSVELQIEPRGDSVLSLESTVCSTGKTGVEMEALTAVSVAALTVYDMCKSLDRSMVIGPVRLEEKAGGRSGHYRRHE
ncbi:MAG: cyclic pyranopterin monophosphate synthase MoaC [Planctomycetota bacterium]